jgi:hypothetical protein
MLKQAESSKQKAESFDCYPTRPGLFNKLAFRAGFPFALCLLLSALKA